MVRGHLGGLSPLGCDRQQFTAPCGVPGLNPIDLGLWYKTLPICTPINSEERKKTELDEGVRGLSPQLTHLRTHETPDQAHSPVSWRPERRQQWPHATHDGTQVTKVPQSCLEDTVL